MIINNFNTITISLSDHEAWILSEILSNTADFHNPETKNKFAIFAAEMEKTISEKIIKK